MPTPTPPVVRTLGARLRAVREAASLTGSELAAALGPSWKQPKVSKIETGRRLPTPEEIAAWAAATGVDPDPLLSLREKAAVEYGAQGLARRSGRPCSPTGRADLARSCTSFAEY